MRTNIEIDDNLLNKVMADGRFKTKRAAVEAGLAVLAKRAGYQKILDLAGKVQWFGDDDNWPTESGDSGQAEAA